MMNSKYKDLKESHKWSNKYFCKLALLNHIRECLEKDNYLKATDTPKTDKGYYILERLILITISSVRM